MTSKNESYKQLWDTRYGEVEYAYGKEPNLFFKEQLEKFKSGSILLPAEGEGRNAVYAATKNWKVTAFDLSEAGKIKALLLAKEYSVSINYLVGDLEHLDFDKHAFDAIGLIYSHFLGNKKSLFHKKLDYYLKPGGIVIFEAFSKKNLSLVKANPKVGGAMDVTMLFSMEEIETDFSNYKLDLLEEREIQLQEGIYHNGIGSVIRFVGRKSC
jgi:ubiquinone/menaquinone biosynthesis C-methylase UbiE